MKRGEEERGKGEGKGREEPLTCLRQITELSEFQIIHLICKGDIIKILNSLW